jgi:hypothetical protein
VYVPSRTGSRGVASPEDPPESCFASLRYIRTLFSTLFDLEEREPVELLPGNLPQL